MQELTEEKITLLEMSSECSSIKQLQKVQSPFIKGTNCASWAEAREKHPFFTTAEQLEPFKYLGFSSSKLPDQFLKFSRELCSKFMNTPADNKDLIFLYISYFIRYDVQNSTNPDTDTVFVYSYKNTISVFLKEDPMKVYPSTLQSLMNVAGVKNGFPGLLYQYLTSLKPL